MKKFLKRIIKKSFFLRISFSLINLEFSEMRYLCSLYNEYRSLNLQERDQFKHPKFNNDNSLKFCWAMLVISADSPILFLVSLPAILIFLYTLISELIKWM